MESKNETWKKKYALDIAHAFQYTRWFFKILGVWPIVKSNPNGWEIYESKMLIITCVVLLGFLIIPCTLHTIFLEKDPMTRLTLLGPISFWYTSVLKYYSMIYHREQIKRCIQHVEHDWMKIETENDRKIIIRNVNVGRYITVICSIFMYTGGLSYHTILPLWRGNEINGFNETIRPLAYPGYEIFVNPYKSPNYEIIFFTVCLSACVIFTITMAACNLASIFVAHISGQIEIIVSRFETFFDDIDETSELLGSRISFIVKSHVRVLRLTSMTENMLREICLVEVVASIVIICLLEYYCLTTWNDSDTIAIITYFTLLTSMTFNVFIFCLIGELLKGQCAQISEVAYMMDWYRLPNTTGLALIMIIAVANRPRTLTAGRMMELSVNSFGSIIRTSVVYLNILRKMAD